MDMMGGHAELPLALCFQQSGGYGVAGAFPHVLVENFQKSPITALQMVIDSDAPEMDIVYIEGVFLGLVLCPALSTPPVPPDLLGSCTQENITHIWVWPLATGP